MTIQQEIAKLTSGTIVYRDEYKSNGRYSYSDYYTGESTVNPADSPLTQAEQAELKEIQRRRIAERTRKPATTAADARQ